MLGSIVPEPFCGQITDTNDGKKLGFKNGISIFDPLNLCGWSNYDSRPSKIALQQSAHNSGQFDILVAMLGPIVPEPYCGQITDTNDGQKLGFKNVISIFNPLNLCGWSNYDSRPSKIALQQSAHNSGQFDILVAMLGSIVPEPFCGQITDTNDGKKLGFKNVISIFNPLNLCGWSNYDSRPSKIALQQSAHNSGQFDILVAMLGPIVPEPYCGQITDTNDGKKLSEKST